MKHLELREIIYREWDPIGISSMSEFDLHSDTEYDGYIRKIENILKSRGNFKEIAQFLGWAEEHMGLQMNEAKNLKIARNIVLAAGLR